MHAGTGKSYIIKHLVEEIIKQDKTFKSLTPTNKAANIINVITLHKFVSKLRNAKCLDKLNVDYIFVDEISMVNEIFYKFLIMLKSKKPNIKFIIVGDFNQLKPVKDRVQCNYKQCLPLIDLCDCNRLELSICRRSDDTLFNMCKFKNIMNIKKSNFNSKQTSKCISFLHKTRIEINNKCMNEKIKKYKEKALR